jgi:ABC-type bacteriocin/lantibiotic exporter with double-glycine peptidase domain
MDYIKSFEAYVDDDFPHRQQTKQYNCGAASLRILLDFLKFPENITMDYIEEISGLNEVVGCTDVNMAQALKYLNLNNKRIVNKPLETSMDLLTESLLNEKKIILRTLTKGIKHWIIVYKYLPESKEFYCSDPWLGKLSYTTEELIGIWKPRNFDCFIITP